MNKSDLIAAIAAKTGSTKKDAEATLNAFVDVVTDSLVKGDKVQLVGFGSFEVRKRAARKGRNQNTCIKSTSIQSWKSIKRLSKQKIIWIL